MRLTRPLGPFFVLVTPLAAAAADPACDHTGELAETICALRDERREDRDLRPEAYFFEPSKVFLQPFGGRGESSSGSQDRLAIEVEFNETIFPYQYRLSPADRHFGGRSFALGVTPMYRVRIWRERSAPVRVPSFMPKATAQINWMDRRLPGKQWGMRDDGSRGYVKITSLMTTVGHHSNGQDGCLFADAEGVGFAPSVCPTAPDRVYINRLNGSFSTNYLQVALYRAYVSVPRTATGEAIARRRAGLWGDDRRASYSFFVGGAYEWHFPFNTFGGALAETIRPIYGLNRVRVMGGYERYPEDRKRQPRFRATGWAQLIAKSEDSDDCGLSGRSGSAGQPCAPRWGFGADVSISVGRMVDYLGLHARYFYGQDYYNLSFTHSKQYKLQVGLSFTPGRSRGPAFPTLEQRVLDEEAKFAAAGKWEDYRGYVQAQGKSSSSQHAKRMAP